jgi:drug/metabolite transporter (DMT)-like permease
MDRLDTRGALAAAAAAILYGSSYVATAVALRSFTPLAAAAGRGLLGALLLGAILFLPAAAALRLSRPHAGALGRLILLGLLGGPIFIMAMNVAVALSGATITAFVAGLYAVLAAILAIPLLGERPERATALSLAVALLGTALLSDLRPSVDLLGGIAVGLVAAISFGSQRSRLPVRCSC